MTQTFKPEGFLIGTEENSRALASQAGLLLARDAGTVLEARAAMCDEDHNLFVGLGPCTGVIPRGEGAMGIADGSVRDIAILSRVGKPVCFTVQHIGTDVSGAPTATLSRRAAQQKCVDQFVRWLTPGDIIPAKVTHLEPFGAFCDIGCGVPSLLPIDSVSVSRISHPSDRFTPGDVISAAVRSAENARITLTLKELLGSWEENAAGFAVGQTVEGTVRSVEPYGIFVELTPNLAGLAELKPDVFPGQTASVFIKNIIPERMKVKLIVIDSFYTEPSAKPLRYYVTGERISKFRYSPDVSEKVIETIFR